MNDKNECAPSVTVISVTAPGYGADSTQRVALHFAPCPVCGKDKETTTAIRGRSGKSFLMLICPEDGRHFRAFITFQPYVSGVLGRSEKPREKGCHAGRPSVWARPGFQQSFGAVLERIQAGSISRRRAAQELRIGYATLKRLLDNRPAVAPSGTET